jgi:hypothetical protein
MTSECLIAQSLGWTDWSGWFRELKKALILYHTVRVSMHGNGYRVLAEYDATVSEDELRGCIKPAEKLLSSQFEFVNRQAFRDMHNKTLYTLCKKALKFRVQPPPEYSIDTGNPWYEVERGIMGLLALINIDILRAHRHNAAIFPSELDVSVVSYKLGKRLGVSKRDVFTDLCKMTIPDFSQLTLHDILELRKCGTIKDFRERIGTLSESVISRDYRLSFDRVQEIREMVSTELLNEVFAYVKDTQPRIKETIMKGVVTEIPVPILDSIISAAVTTEELIKQWKLRQSHGWLFFISEMHRRSQKSPR